MKTIPSLTTARALAAARLNPEPRSHALSPTRNFRHPWLRRCLRIWGFAVPILVGCMPGSCIVAQPSFVEVSTAGTFSPTRYNAGASWGDYDGDGDLDVVVANQGGTSFLYKNLLQETGQPGFVPLFRGTDPETRGIRFTQSGCVAWGDLNNDGRLDLVISNDDLGFRINFATSEGQYGPSSYYGGGVRMIALMDVDNDGDLDVLADMTTGSGGYQLFLNEDKGGNFTSQFFATARQSSYVQNAPAVGDFNNDGYPDVFLVYPGLPGALFANQGGDNRWLKLVLKGTSSNATGVGAIVRVKATIEGEVVWQMRQVSAGGEAWRVQHDMRPNFGLGDAARADLVRVEWPSGAVQELADVDTNQILTVTEPPVVAIESAVILSWPIRAEGYALFGAENAEGPWVRIEIPVVVAGDHSAVTIKATDRMRLYRLEKPADGP